MGSRGNVTSVYDPNTRALFIMDALEPITDEALKAAAQELISTLKKLNSDIVTYQQVLKATSG
ncbi:hypothetical protein ACMFMF_005316 [Clarireedia jacksonii]